MCVFYLPNSVFGDIVLLCFANQNIIEVSDSFDLTVDLKLINFSSQIFHFVPEKSTLIWFGSCNIAF